MRTDITGVPNTCPLINDVIDFIEYCSKQFGDNENFQNFDCIDVLNKLEEIRTSNEKLRSFGVNTFDDYENTLSDRNYYEDRYEDALEQIKQLQSEIDYINKHENI